MLWTDGKNDTTATKTERMKLFGVNTIDSQLVRMKCWKASNRTNEICCGWIKIMMLRATKIERMRLFGVNTIVTMKCWKASSRKNEICCGRIERMILRVTKIERMRLFSVNMKYTDRKNETPGGWDRKNETLRREHKAS